MPSRRCTKRSETLLSEAEETGRMGQILVKNVRVACPSVVWDDLSSMFHVSHSLCRPISVVPKAPLKAENRPLSAAVPTSQRTRQNFLRPSLLFPSETHLKTCGKSDREIYTEKMCKTCGKHADFLRITHPKTVQKPADNLRGRGGKTAENHPISRLHPVD
jgi:hypothetical protein